MIIKCVAFFWVGNNIDIPSIYVKSIRLIYGDNIIIFQLTDHTTVEVEGIDKVLRNKLSKNIMVARLEAYSMINFNNEHVLFTDADSLMINKYDIFNVDDIILLPRSHSFKMNPNFPEYYPEFIDKNSGDLMPYLFGAIVARNSNIFEILLRILISMPDRFHRWYGDQISLAFAVKNSLFKFSLLDPDVHLRILSNTPTEKEFNTIRNFSNKVQLLSFKGQPLKKKIMMDLSIKLLENNLLEINN
jgi:hypothetical protein